MPVFPNEWRCVPIARNTVGEKDWFDDGMQAVWIVEAHRGLLADAHLEVQISLLADLVRRAIEFDPQEGGDSGDEERDRGLHRGFLLGL